MYIGLKNMIPCQSKYAKLITLSKIDCMIVFGIKVYHATSTLEFFRSNMNYEHLEVIV